MLREHCTVGMKVMFGRGNGEQTLGEVVKVNPTKAKVKTLEDRGRSSMAGTVWTVPYSLMKPAGVAFIDELNSMPPLRLDSADQPLPVYMPYGDARIMEAILDCYTRLSPEYLTADGERPRGQVTALRNSINSRLSHLFKALGRPVSEEAAYKWEEARKKEAV